MRILITGKNSYIGTSFETWLKQYGDKYQVHSIDVKGEDWKQHDFSQYDVVLHVAGIAHVSSKKSMKDLYYKVNRDLAISVAEKAKAEGIKQFIFMSSMIVYGEHEYIGSDHVITKDTPPSPLNYYGDSKLQADIAIRKLETEEFKVACIRPPMVYGPNGKGNFPKLLKLAKFTPIFPSLENKRSMLYIDNLCEFLRLVIDTSSNGIFFPQNKEYVDTKQVIQIASQLQGKSILYTNAMNGLIKVSGKFYDKVNKVFGNKVYDLCISNYFNHDYLIIDFTESIELCIRELQEDNT